MLDARADPRWEEAPGSSAALGTFAGFALLALTGAICIAIGVPRAPGGLGLRAAHHFFEIACTLGLGALSGLAIGAWVRVVATPWWASAAVFTAACAPIQLAMLGNDFDRQAAVTLEGRFETPIFVVYMILAAASVPAAHVVGTWFSRWKWLRWLPIVVAVAAMVANHFVLADDYFGSHGAVAWAAATLAGAAISPLAARVGAALWARRGGRAAALAIGAWAAIGIIVPPSNSVRVQLFRDPCTLAWVQATALWRAPSLHAATPAPTSPWLDDRSAFAPIAPTKPPMVTRSPVVVLLTIDATRADAIADPANDAAFPTLTEMKRQGAFFTQATSPGSQTAVSLSSTFASRAFSEMYWSMHGVGSSRFAYPCDEPTDRFPALLTANGVKTMDAVSINFLAADFGVVRGFGEEKIVTNGRSHAAGKAVIDPIVERLRRAGPEPLFLYAHLTEPHAPYDRGRKDGTERERYLSEIAVADAQVARVWLVLRQRFGDRGFLIVSADHGEAFGEHATFQHTKTLYEELVRVPLLVRGPGVVPRTITERVGLVDLGPTILDLFGVETPAAFEGQSLVPLLEGRSRSLDRPLVAEGRLRRAMYVAEGLKVIEDDRRKTVEVYDLGRDPGELDNLFDRDPGRSDVAVTALRAFFANHKAKRAGYRPVYKP
ncbi:MAG: sulfatase-like hydrolase/transferase [Byssovorax sp.]